MRKPVPYLQLSNIPNVSVWPTSNLRFPTVFVYTPYIQWNPNDSCSICKLYMPRVSYYDTCTTNHHLSTTLPLPNCLNSQYNSQLGSDKKFPAKNRPRLILGKTGKIIILLFFLNILLLTHIIRASHSKKFSSFIGPVKRQNRTMLRATRRWGSNLAAHGLRSAPHLLLSLLVGSGSALWKEQTPEVNTAGKPERFSKRLGHRGSAQRLHSKNPPGKPRGGDRGRNRLGVLYWARLHIQQAPGSHWWQFNFAMQDNFLNKMIPEL